MINYILNDSDLVRGRDIRTIIDEVNANEIISDNLTIVVDKNEGGTSIQVIDQFGGGSSPSEEIATFPFQTTMAFDTDEDVFNVSVNAGQVVLPVGQSLLPTYEFTNPKDVDVYIYLKISGVQSINGGWDTFTGVIEESSIQQVNTDDINYFLISFIIEKI